jgi:hypothetical protein
MEVLHHLGSVAGEFVVDFVRDGPAM